MKNKLLEKTFQVLEAVAASPEPVSLKELSGRLGINSSTLSRIAADLVETGYLTKAGYRNFEPALGLIRIGQNAVHSSHLPRTVNPLVRSRVDELGVNGAFAGIESGQVVYLYRSDAFSDENRIGLPYRVPLYRSNIAIAILAMSLPPGRRWNVSGPISTPGTPNTPPRRTWRRSGTCLSMSPGTAICSAASRRRAGTSPFRSNTAVSSTASPFTATGQGSGTSTACCSSVRSWLPASVRNWSWGEALPACIV
ncbi:MAG: helix-turn-helix domain-containing protein [Victivallis sp.]